MKKILTNNIGLKILSVFVSVVLWIIVVNVDDPVITRVYSGIPVEVVNPNAITDEGKTYEIIDDTDTISVAVTAERSIIESLTKDNVKAYADMKNITFMNTVPIELRTNRYSEKINSITSRSNSISVLIEDRKEKQMKLTVETEGEVAAGYISGDVTPAVDVIKVSGPESKVNLVSKAEIVVDYSEMNETFTTSSPITLFDSQGRVIDDPAIEVSKSEITATVEILEIKEIPITAYYVGTAANGFSATGTVVCDPSSVRVAGKGSSFDNLSSVKIPDEILSIDGAMENTANTVNIKEYLPKGVKIADPDFNGDVNVVAVIEAHDLLMVELPVANISVVNLPENYHAHVVYGEQVIPMEVSGLADNLVQLTQTDITAQIDAAMLSRRITDDDDEEDGSFRAGTYDGPVLLTLPSGVMQNTQMMVEVVINYIDDTSEKTED